MRLRIRNKSGLSLLIGALSMTGAFALTAVADSAEVVVELSIKDHKFEPAELSLPASKPIKILVKNLDASAEEVESKDLGFEKVIGGNSEGIIRLKALQAGNYGFYGEYHEDTAKGRIVVK
jgi:plastocyanin